MCAFSQPTLKFSITFVAMVTVKYAESAHPLVRIMNIVCVCVCVFRDCVCVCIFRDCVSAVVFVKALSPA